MTIQQPITIGTATYVVPSGLTQIGGNVVYTNTTTSTTGSTTWFTALTTPSLPIGSYIIQASCTFTNSAVVSASNGYIGLCFNNAAFTLIGSVSSPYTQSRNYIYGLSSNAMVASGAYSVVTTLLLNQTTAGVLYLGAVYAVLTATYTTASIVSVMRIG